MLEFDESHCDRGDRHHRWRVVHRADGDVGGQLLLARPDIDVSAVSSDQSRHDGAAVLENAFVCHFQSVTWIPQCRMVFGCSSDNWFVRSGVPVHHAAAVLPLRVQRHSRLHVLGAELGVRVSGHRSVFRRRRDLEEFVNSVSGRRTIRDDSSVDGDSISSIDDNESSPL